MIAALRRLRGRATLGDIVSATGMPEHQAETELKGLLETRRGHLEVSDSGDLLYRFDPGLIARDQEPASVRFKRAAWAAFKTGFKVWTAVMLVVYFVVFVLLILAVMAANRDDRGGFGGRGGFGLGDLFLLHWLMGGRGWSRGSLYYGHSHAKRLPKDAKPPFYKKVFAFIFGPDEPRPTRLQRDREVLRLIRSRNGVLTAAELVEHNGLRMPEAVEEMGRLTGAYGGDPQVSDRGEVVYAFPGLMKSAHGRVSVRDPHPAWHRLQHPKKLTGNSAGSNWGIGAMNGFNLAASIALGLPAGGLAVSPLWFWGLGVVPVTFSGMFFGIPLLRSLSLRGENRNRLRSNIRRLLVGLVYSRSVGTVRDVTVGEAVEHVTRGLRGWSVSPKMVLKELETLAAEFDADVSARDQGFVYRFPAIRESYVDAELVRRRLALQEQTLGRIVYATSDTAAEADERDQESFDLELSRAEVDVSKYRRALGEGRFVEDFELFADELDAGAPGRRPGRVTVRRRPPPRSRPGWR